MSNIKEAIELIEKASAKGEDKYQVLYETGGFDTSKYHLVCTKDIDQALAKLRTEQPPASGTCICMDCGKVIKVAEQSNHLKECPREKPNCQEPKPVLPPVTGKRKQGHSQLKYDPKLKAIISIDPHPDCQAPEQPPAGEFTKKVRKDWDKNIFGGVIFDLCTRLDRSEASRNELLTACENARLSIKIMSLPRLDILVASNDDLLQIMDASLEAAIAKEKKVKK